MLHQAGQHPCQRLRARPARDEAQQCTGSSNLPTQSKNVFPWFLLVVHGNFRLERQPVWKLTSVFLFPHVLNLLCACHVSVQFPALGAWESAALFLALHTRINKPVICVAFHGRNPSARHFKDSLQLMQLSNHDSSHEGAKERRGFGAANPILHRNFCENEQLSLCASLLFLSSKTPRQHDPV